MTPKTKALIKLHKIVESCVNIGHFNMAYTYYYLFEKRFGFCKENEEVFGKTLDGLCKGDTQ